MAKRRELSLVFAETHPGDSARVLDRLTAEDAAAFFRFLPVRLGAPVLRQMLPLAAAHCLQLLDDEIAVALVRELDAQSGAAILRHLSPARRDRLVGELPTASALAFRFLLGYPEDAVGAWVQPHVLALPPDMSVATALDHLRQSSDSAGGFLYVIDAGQRLLGAVSVIEALRAGRGATLGQVMHPQRTALSARSSLRAARADAAWREHHSLPVVEHGQRLIGALEFAVLCQALERQDAAPAGTPAAAGGGVLATGLWTLFAGLLQATVALLPGTPANGREGGRDAR